MQSDWCVLVPMQVRKGFCMMPMVQLPEPLLNHSMSVRKDGQIGKQRGCWQALSWQVRLLQSMHQLPAFHTWSSIERLSSEQPADRPGTAYCQHIKWHAAAAGHQRLFRQLKCV